MFHSSIHNAFDRVLKRAVALTLCLLLPACGTLSVQDEKTLGHKVQRDVQQHFTMMRDPIVVNYIREIGADVAGGSRESVFDFRFYVVEDPSINAFAIPGGAIYVHTGLIQKANTEGEIAGVLAHEIGHVTARHVAKNYNRQRSTGVVAQVVAMAIAIVSGNTYIARGGAVATDVAAQSYLNTYTQDAERESDALAVEALINAGYDPEAMISMFRLLQAEGGGGGTPQFLKSHPATSERIRNVQYLIRKSEPLPPHLKNEDQKLPIIQKRIELIVGTDRSQGEE